MDMVNKQGSGFVDNCNRRRLEKGQYVENPADRKSVV